ncbi:family 20 glycosylhydrolase [Rubrolithibacter danxiaensis]|uniref:glycoside hydrolase family 20 protein n=1 Tax=Rubrolithibacter danxiaensis TaxID=3390805 RepID=UPI003BF89055
MRKKQVLFLFILLYPVLLFAQSTVSIIPKPVQLRLGNGYFTIDNHTTIRFKRSEKELKSAADFFASYIKNISGYELPLHKQKEKSIQLIIEKISNIGDEGYQLYVTASGIIIKANTKAGIVYGMQSLFQTLPQIHSNAALQVPCMDITDYPRFKWRGMHLDVSRHFFSPEMVKEYINLLASYKMNTFHWHLVDDQGWRIEIKKYPELTKTGAWRVNQTDKVWSDRPQAKPEEIADYGGFYTQEQIKEIIEYAAQRNVTIVPEIEMPGHVASAISAYPFLSCAQKPQLPLTGGDYTGMSSNYCPGNEEVFAFVQNVLSEVIALFPSKYIHIGGDEVDKTSWKNCPRCQARIKAEGLKDENELQSYFIKRIEKYLISKDRKMIGWDEILEGGLAPEATVMSWRGESGGIEAAKMKHEVIMTPGYPVYFDHYQAGPEGEPFAIGGFNTLKKVYDYEPVPKELNNGEEKYVLGAQANVWTEYITTPEHLEYMVLPRMLALAEVVWAPKENKDWVGFNKRLQYHFAGFEQKGLRYSPGNFKVDITPKSQNGKLNVTLSTESIDGTIYYTLDGTEPSINSKRYAGPVSIDSSVLLKAVTVLNGKVMGAKPAEQSFVMHQAIGRNVTYRDSVSTYYRADGPNSLTDGVRGTTAVGKYWHGWFAKDLVATVDLGEEKTIHSMTIGCLQNYRDWIFLPQYVKFELSVDGKNYKEVKTSTNTISPDEKNALKHDFRAEFSGQKAKFIRITAKNLGQCPKGHSGEGQPAWLFADEIIVE